MDDLISRQAVKEWLAKWEGYIDADIIARMQYRIIDLPSAQPEPCVDAVINTQGLDEEIRCEMCKNPMRSDNGCDGGCQYDEKLYEKIIKILDERIKTLPSVRPERKQGKWIFKERREPVYDISGVKTWGIAYMCSECRFIHTVIEDFGQYVFCPNCGADMREGQDE